eukprot:3482125-Rhodomonas_salina.2
MRREPAHKCGKSPGRRWPSGRRLASPAPVGGAAAARSVPRDPNTVQTLSTTQYRAGQTQYPGRLVLESARG